MKIEHVELFLKRWLARPEIREPIVDFFAEQFVTREPLARALGITAAEFRPLAEMIVDDSIRERTCFVIKNDEQTAIAGLLILRDAAREIPGDLSAACPAAAPIHRLLDEVSRPYLEQNPPLPGKTLDGMFILVDARYEGQGTVLKFCAIAAAFALAMGYVELIACVTNPRSQKVLRNYGGVILNRISATDYFRGMGLTLGEDAGEVAFGRIDVKVGKAVKDIVAQSVRRARRRMSTRAVGARA